MATVAQLQVLVTANVSGAVSGLQTVSNSIQKLTSATAQSGKSFGGIFGTFSVAAGNLVSSGIQYITRNVVDMGKSAVGAYSDFERMQFALSSIAAQQLINSGAATNMNDAIAQGTPVAQELYSWLLKLAIKSPFTEANIGMAVKTASAYGLNVEEAKKLVTSLADLGTATGMNERQFDTAANALAKIASEGKLTGRAITQLSRDGVPVLQLLSRYFGKTEDQIREMVHDGLIPADLFFKAFNAQVGKEYGGAVDRFIGSTAGLLNALGDIRAVLLRTFAGPIIEAFKPALKSVVDLLSNPATLATVRGWGEKFGEMATKILPSLGSAAQAAGRGFMGMIDFVGRVIKDFGIWKSGVVSLKTILESLGVPSSVAGGLADFINKLAEKFQQIAGFISDHIKPAFDWLTNVGLPALGQGLEFAARHFDELSAAFAGMSIANAVIGALGAILAIIMGMATPITLVVAAVGLLSAAWAGNWFGMRDALQSAWASIQPKLEEFSNWFSTKGGPAIATFASNIGTALKPALDSIGSWVDTQGVRFSSWWTTNLPIIQQSITNFTIGAQFTWQAFTTGLETIWQNFGTNITGLVSNWGAGLDAAFQGITNAIGGTIRAGLQLMNGDVAGAMATMQAGWTSGWTTMQAIADGFLNGIAALFGTTIQAIAQTWVDNWNQLSSIVTSKAAEMTASIASFIADAESQFTAFAAGLTASIASAFASASATVAGAVATIEGYINELIGIINSIPRVIDIVFNLITNGSPPSPSSGGGGNWATGTGNVYPGSYMVGENGPEMVYLPAGSKVVNRTQANGGMGPSGAGGGVHVSVTTGPINSDIDIEYLAYRVADVIVRRSN